MEVLIKRNSTIRKRHSSAFKVQDRCICSETMLQSILAYEDRPLKRQMKAVVGGGIGERERRRERDGERERERERERESEFIKMRVGNGPSPY